MLLNLDKKPSKLDPTRLGKPIHRLNESGWPLLSPEGVIGMVRRPIARLVAVMMLLVASVIPFTDSEAIEAIKIPLKTLPPKVVQIPRGNAPTTWPNVNSYTPVDMGPSGGIIMFLGRDLAKDFFVAKIGDRALTITSRAVDRIQATLPSERMIGDLTVGYGNPSSTMLLKAGYRVYDAPKITGVTPTTVQKGDVVTVTGTDLFGADMRHIPETVSGYIRISNKADGWLASDYIKVTDWRVAPDGTRLTFVALDVFKQTGNSSYAILGPQPTSLSGPLRMERKGATGGHWPVVGPPLTWKTSDIVVTAVIPPAWGNQNPDFVIVNYSDGNTPNGGTWSDLVSFAGTGLNGAKVWMGPVEMTLASISATGRDGWFDPPYNATSNYVTFTKDGASARSPTVLKIVGSPRMQDASTGLLQIPLNTDVTISGWDLKTMSIPGLEYEIRMYNQSFNACNLAMQIVSHTSNQIRFRVNTTGAVPQTCLDISSMFWKGTTPPSNVAYHVIQLILKYGGAEREYWRRPYLLLPLPNP